MPGHEPPPAISGFVRAMIDSAQRKATRVVILMKHQLGNDFRTNPMADLHTHYDNLKVARNAPPEVIRAAYKTLSQKFHPDRNLGDSSATRTFQIINSAYAVLSDPVKRREHDKWIAMAEGKKRPVQERGKHGGFGATVEVNAPDQSWQRRTSFEAHAMPRHTSRHDMLKPLKDVLRGGLTKRQAISCIFASFAATLVLFAILATG